MIYGDPLEDNPNIRIPDYLAIRQSANLYGYCLNDPLMFIDSSGNVAASAVLTGGWSIGGSVSLLDGPLPFGDALGIIIGIGGTIISGGMAIGSWWDNLESENEKDLEKEKVSQAPPPNQKIYYHVTSAENAASIVSTGIIM